MLEALKVNNVELQGTVHARLVRQVGDARVEEHKQTKLCSRNCQLCMHSANFLSHYVNHLDMVILQCVWETLRYNTTIPL